MSKEPAAIDAPDEAQRKLVAAKRARGSLVAVLEDRLVKHERLMRDLAAERVAINQTYEKIVAYEAQLPRSEPRTMAPGRRADVTVHLLPPLDERAPLVLPDLSAVMQREREMRDESRRMDEERWRANPPPRLPDTSTVPGGL